MDNMMGTGGKPYIWLRYTTQFTSNGRTHTVEMGIPVPLGASAETREQLIREAEAGIDQLSRHVENRVSQMVQRNSRPQSTTTTSTYGNSIPATPPSANKPTPTSPVPTVTPREVPPTSLQEKKAIAPSARTNTGVNMPHSPNMPGDASNMSLAQFMHFIRENWGLTPKEAMELLNVKTLHGLNLREALKQLQPLVAKDSTSPTGTAGTKMSAEKSPEAGSPKAVEKSTQTSSAVERPTPASASRTGNQPSSMPTPIRTVSNSAAPARPSSAPANRAASTPVPPSAATTRSSATPGIEASTPKSPVSADGSKIPIIPIHSGMVHDAQSAYRFQEEEEEDNELGLDLEDDFADEQLRARAQDKLDKLKEAGGSTAANATRLTVLQNVLGDQISEVQLQQLIHTVWGATSVKKLKVDQVEALISWAKEDDFENEVEAMLTLLEGEESYAGSDW